MMLFENRSPYLLSIFCYEKCRFILNIKQLENDLRKVFFSCALSSDATAYMHLKKGNLVGKCSHFCITLQNFPALTDYLEKI